MKTLTELKTEFLVRNQASTTVGFYTDTILDDWADLGHKFAAGYKKWPFTEGRASTTFASLVTTEDGLLAGEYPEGWKSDGIRLLTIGGKEVEKKEYFSFRRFLENNTGDDSRYFSDFGRRYFVNPNIDLSGTVTAWGQYTPSTLVYEDNESTVFQGEEEGNEAIVELMMSYAAKREKKTQEALAHLEEAKRILEELWVKISDEQYQYQTPPSDGMWKRFDVLGGSMRDDLLNSDQFN